MDRPPCQLPDEMSYEELKRIPCGPMPWLWHGYLAPGYTTMLTSRWKTGKTTLLSLLLSRMGAGGELCGATVRPGRAYIVSEEDAQLWRRRDERVGFGDHVSWLCRPFTSIPNGRDYQELIQHIIRVQQRQSLDLVVFDPLAYVYPGMDENSATAMRVALEPLRQLTKRGLAVLILHHCRKAPAASGTAARGSSALPAHVDIAIEMELPDANATSRRRRLSAKSRFEETPAERLIQLDELSKHYAIVDKANEDDFSNGWTIMRMVFEDAIGKLTRKQVELHWPDDYPRPNDITLWRWLDLACERQLLSRGGAGRKKDPFMYWLPGRDKEWHDDRIDLTLEPKYTQREFMRKADQILRLHNSNPFEGLDYGRGPNPGHEWAHRQKQKERKEAEKKSANEGVPTGERPRGQ